MNLLQRFFSLFTWATVASAARPRISPAGVAWIAEFETGGRSYYNSHLSKPTWPEGMSGVTIGCGYDLGYNTPDQIAADWKDQLATETITRLQRCAGVKGSSARAYLTGLADIRVSWDAALMVFQARTIPRFGKQAWGAFPGMEKLPVPAQEALLSLVFNRGPALHGANRQDMEDIHDILADGVQNGDLAAIAQQLREMKRIWVGKGLDGLLARREEEARRVESAIEIQKLMDPTTFFNIA